MKWTIAWSIRLTFVAAVTSLAVVALLNSVGKPAAPHVWRAHLLPALMPMPHPAKAKTK
jgi:hypothetical protein